MALFLLYSFCKDRAIDAVIADDRIMGPYNLVKIARLMPDSDLAR